MKVAPGGIARAAVPLVAAPVGLVVHPLFSLALVGLGAFTLYFFRDPDRSPPATGVVSPADGTVSVIREEDDRMRIGVYMNALDVHVNRAPLDGPVESVEHVPGGHRLAFSKESEHNERVHVDLPEARVTLIAGAFARRVVPYVEAGDEPARGDRIAHIAFGSRADVLLAPAYDRGDVHVTEGEGVRAGETVLADDPDR